MDLINESVAQVLGLYVPRIGVFLNFILKTSRIIFLSYMKSYRDPVTIN